MEFLLLGGVILVMPLFAKVSAIKEANKILVGLQIPIGLIVLLVGLSSLMGPLPAGIGGRPIFPGIMGVIAGATLMTGLYKQIPTKAEETLEKVSSTLISLQVPIGIATIIAALTAMF